MKKSNFFVLSVAALLTLGACSGNGSDNKGGKKWYEFEDPNVELSDVATPTMNIAFANVEDNCMVSPKVKAYVDAMEEQEKTLDRPYHFSSLYGPDDYAALAAASISNNGKDIPDENKGGVDVCQYLDRDDYGNKAENYPIQLTWSNGDVTFDSAKLKFWSTEDQSDLREIDLGANATSAQLPNLYRARKYRVQLVAGDQVSNSFEFTTGDYPRTITMGDIKNVRDIGGYPTSYGVRTNQGLMYRGYYIDDKSGGHGVNYTAAAGQVQDEVMKIGYELDLQKSSETNGRTTSCLNGSKYKCLTLISFANFLTQESYQNLPEVMHIMANSDQEHSYFHCWGGADRTGMLAFFVNAICGVSYTDLIEDFEITTETNNKRCHMHNDNNAYFPKFLNAFMNEWDGFDAEKTINENCEKWMIEVAHVAEEDIEGIRKIMLPGYAEGNLSLDTNIPSFTAKGNWQSDERGHWQVAKEDKDVKVNWGSHKGKECEICGYDASQQGGSDENDDDFTQPISHVWTVTSTANNADGKQYQQIKDNNKNKVGVRILQSAISSTSEATFDSDNKLPSDGGSVTYQVKAPKAGTYQMVMNGRVSDASKKLSERGITVKLNGVTVDIDGANRDGGLNGAGDNDFVMCPSINLTGNEDTITVACKNYRIAFNLSSTCYLVFAEH